MNVSLMVSIGISGFCKKSDVTNAQRRPSSRAPHMLFLEPKQHRVFSQRAPEAAALCLDMRHSVAVHNNLKHADFVACRVQRVREIAIMRLGSSRGTCCYHGIGAHPEVEGERAVLHLLVHERDHLQSENILTQIVSDFENNQDVGAVRVRVLEH
jgi:hypothetical protein